MRRAWLAVTLGALATVVVAGCAGTRVESGIFYSKKGYRVAVPGGDWVVTGDGGVDLTLRHRDGRSAIAVNASCDAARARGPLDVLARHLLSGLRDRSVVTRDQVSIDGHMARHAVVEGRAGDTGERVTVELYVLRDERCLYDFLYVAPPAAFEAQRPDFDRVVRGFTRE